MPATWTPKPRCGSSVSSISVNLIVIFHIIGGVIFTSAAGLFGTSRVPIFLAHLSCTGRETSVLQCRSTYFSDVECDHNLDVRLKCEGQLICSHYLV